MANRILITTAAFLLCLAGLVSAQSTNSTRESYVSIATYYPAPTGVYKELRLFPTNSPKTCDNVNHEEGWMYYDQSQKALFICSSNDGGANYGWLPVSGTPAESSGNPPVSDGSSGNWAISGNNLYNTNTGNVGIGTTNPGVKLDVTGDIRTTKLTVGTGAVPANAIDGQLYVGRSVVFNSVSSLPATNQQPGEMVYKTDENTFYYSNGTASDSFGPIAK
jgi:hypothetical protein